MITKIKTTRLAAAALVAAASAVISSSALAGAGTSYTSGDIFIGFRQTDATNTLAVNIGSPAQFTPTALGGSWNGNPFNVTFGIIPAGSPGAGSTVTNLNADLVATFGAGWATNNTENTSLDVSWSVVGVIADDNTPINNLPFRSIFKTYDDGNPTAVISSPSNTANTNAFSSNFDSFVRGLAGNNYLASVSTDNSDKAVSVPKSGANSWSGRLGLNGNFGSGVNTEQATGGAFSGPTDSALDFYLDLPSAVSGFSDRTYLGTFALSSAGVLTYSAVPEPSTYALLALSGVAFVIFRRRHRLKSLSK